MTVGQVCQKLGVSEPTFSRWRQQYGNGRADQALRVKELEAENTRLKKLVGSCPWTSRCSRKSSGESSDAVPAVSGGERPQEKQRGRGSLRRRSRLATLAT